MSVSLSSSSPTTSPLPQTLPSTQFGQLTPASDSPPSSLPTLILAIDTSCDDTSVAVLQTDYDGHHLSSAHFTILSSIVSSQIELHRPYGGVFPTVAKLAHQENIIPCLNLALKKAAVTWADLHALAVTQGPGLAPALEVGLHHAQALSAEHHLPLIPINHVEAHAWSPLLSPHSKTTTPQPPLSLTGCTFPLLSLVVSGGHTEFLLITAPGQYQILGQTLDDAAGECLDKIGRLLNLGYPAGPTIEKLAHFGDPHSFTFPLPLTTRHDFDLSFSGLKTAARNLISHLSPTQLDQTTIYNLAASAQFAVFRHITYKLTKLLQHLQTTTPPSLPTQIWLGGGVAANITFRRQLRAALRPFHLALHTPYRPQLCGDNAAMIALVATLKYPYLAPLSTPSPAPLDRQPNLTVTSWK